jgi:3',5'-cyclic AMP phosphodiesterase CpdA
MVAILMYLFYFKRPLILIVTTLLLAGCGSEYSNYQPSRTAKFAVLSDTHLYDGATFGVGSQEFIATSVRENKLLSESVEILSGAITTISSSDIDFVLVTGDLTKDGERKNHELMASKLAELKAHGKKVFVIPGNHDINNPLALSYTTSPPSPVANIGPAEFERIYADFGYRDALFRDPDSLSYIAEPVPGMWLFALDSCLYASNAYQESPTTSGAFGNATRMWIIARLVDARSQGKVVIGMMHHGILEHFAGQSVEYPEYVLNNWREVAADLSGHGLRTMFTGHFHATDITSQKFSGSLLYDIETGSLVTYPNSYRIAEYNFNRNELSLHSERVSSIPAFSGNFVAYSQKTSKNNLKEISMRTLSIPPYSLEEPTLSTVSQYIVSGLMSHYSGNEVPSFFSMTSFQALSDSANPATHALGHALESLWTDLTPADNSLNISLESEL